MDSFGTRLKREREKRKISLDDVSAVTKISNRFLSAIESDHFDQLPGGIFNRGFIRAYARHLGLDEDQIISEYLAASGEDDPNVPIEPVPDQKVWAQDKENSPAPSLPWKELSAVLLLIVLAVVFWKFRGREAGKPTQPTQDAASNSADVASTPTPVSPAVTPRATLTSSAATHATSAASQPFQLRIVPREDSWISVSGPQGEILHQILSPPAEKSFHSSSRIVVRAGNVGGLDFIWNGRPIPSQGKEGEVKTLIFDGTGVHYPPPPPAVPSTPQ